MKISRLSFPLLAAAFFLIYCSPAQEEDKHSVHCKFDTRTQIIYVDSTYMLPLQVSVNLGPYDDYDFEQNRYDIQIASRDTKIVEVVGPGKVKGVSAGSTVVSAKVQKQTVYLDLIVVDKEKPGEEKPLNKDSLTVVNAGWNWTTASTGVTTGYATFSLFDKQASISVAHYPASNLALKIVYHTGTDCLTTSAAAKAASAKVAINGSFFNTTSLIANTFYASGGTIICNKALDTRSNGIVGIKAGGHDVDIKTASTTMFNTYASTYHDVIASGPVLLQNGKISDNPHNEFNDTSHPRSIIGKDASGNIWMIVIDGRFPGLGEGASIAECSLICRYLGLTDAINLDGGGSSSLWTPSTGVINHPYDNKKWDHSGERKDPTVFVAL